MKKLISIAVATWLVAGAAANAEITGAWLSEYGDAAISVWIEGEELRGRIAWLANPLDCRGRPQVDESNPDEDLRGESILGMTLLWGFERSGDDDGSWSGGRIYDPQNGKTYRCKIRLDGDVLRIRGYVGLPILGRTTEWTRVSLDELSSGAHACARTGAS